MNTFRPLSPSLKGALFTAVLALLHGCASVAPTSVPPGSTPAQSPGTLGDVSQGVPAPAAASDAVPVTYGRTTPLTLDLTQKPDDVWTRIRNGFSVPNIDVALVRKWEEYYASRPDYMQRMTERASLYLFHVVEELEKRGMPMEIALLPFVESAYNPKAYSTAHASGMWQFIPSTGRSYNLKQNRLQDQRRDVRASTNAALDYLQYLFEFHGDWHLALASYNWGEGSVKRAIEKNRARDKPTDYLSLDMPAETRNYVPKLQAIKNIIARPANYQLILPTIGNEPYFVTVKKTRDIDIATAAKLADMSMDDFKALNPSFDAPFIPGSSEAAELLLPADRVETFLTNLNQHEGPLSTWTTYKVRRSETLSSLAKRLKVSALTLASVNRMPLTKKIYVGKGRKKRSVTRSTVVGAGTLLVIPRNASVRKSIDGSAASGERNASSGRTSTTAYVVKRGDTLTSIARRFATTTARLRTLNKMRSDIVRLGTRLKVDATDPDLKVASP